MMMEVIFLGGDGDIVVVVVAVAVDAGGCDGSGDIVTHLLGRQKIWRRKANTREILCRVLLF